MITESAASPDRPEDPTGRRETGKYTLARNTAWNYAGLFFNVIANFVLFPVLVRGLGDSATGVLTLIGSVTGYMGLLELGLVPSLSQVVAVSLARRDKAAVSRAVSTAAALLLALASVPILLSLVVPALVAWLDVPAHLEGDARLALTISMIGFGLRMPQAVLQAVLLGAQRQDRANQLWIGLAGVKLSTSLLLLSLGFGLVAIVTMEATVHLVAGFIQYVWVRAELPSLRFSPRLVNRSDVGSLTGFGGVMLVSSVSRILVEQSDRLVIGAFLPIAMVTHYSAGWKIYRFARMLPLTLVQAVFPLAADRWGSGDHEGLRSLFLRMTKYSVALVWPVGIVLAMSAPFLLRVWLGPSFMDAVSVVRVLVVAFLVTAHNHVGYSVLVGTRRLGVTLWPHRLPEALLNLGLSLLLVRPMGIVGVALGTAIPALALEYVFLRILLRELQIGWGQFATVVVRPTAGPALVAFAPLFLAAGVLDPAAAPLFLLGGACAAVYGIVFWTRQLTEHERRELLAHVPLPAWAARRRQRGSASV